MKRGLLASMAVCALAAPLMADMIQVGDTIRFYDREGSTDGGEFGLAMSGSPNQPELFRTFCLQRDEHLEFNPNGFKVVGISEYVEMQHDHLDARTAYLYTQFRNGTLSHYVYTLGGSAGGVWDHVDSANELQKAFWAIEGETGMPTPTSQAGLWIAEAANQITQGHWSGLGNVRVLNITWATNRYASAGTPAQDVLTIVPAPGATLLLGIGLSLVTALKRRFA